MVAGGLTRERIKIQHDLLKIGDGIAPLSLTLIVGKEELKELQKLKKHKEPTLTEEEKVIKVDKSSVKGVGKSIFASHA